MLYIRHTCQYSKYMSLRSLLVSSISSAFCFDPCMPIILSNFFMQQAGATPNYTQSCIIISAHGLLQLLEEIIRSKSGQPRGREDSVCNLPGTLAFYPQKIVCRAKKLQTNKTPQLICACGFRVHLHAYGVNVYTYHIMAAAGIVHVLLITVLHLPTDCFKIAHSPQCITLAGILQTAVLVYGAANRSIGMQKLYPAKEFLGGCSTKKGKLHFFGYPELYENKLSSYDSSRVKSFLPPAVAAAFSIASGLECIIF